MRPPRFHANAAASLLAAILAAGCGDGSVQAIPDPHTDPSTGTAKIRNDRGPRIVIDGGGKGAVFFVSNDLTGHLSITDSVLSGNPSAGGWDTAGFPGIFYLGSGPILISGSTVE